LARRERRKKKEEGRPVVKERKKRTSFDDYLHWREKIAKKAAKRTG